MARWSRLLSAVSLGVAVPAAVGAVVVAVERNPVRRTPTHLAESASSGRVIVKFKERASILSATGSSARSVGPQKAGVLGGRLGLALTDGRILGERTQVMQAKGMTSSALARSIAADSEVEWVQVDHRRFVQAAPPVNDPLYPDGQAITFAQEGPESGQWYLRAPGLDASGHNVVSSINIEPAWAITHGSSAIVIADVDTGITAHPDLSAKLFPAIFQGTTSSTPYGYDFVGYGETDPSSSADAVAIANDGDLADPDPSDPGDYVTGAENADKTGTFYECNDSDYPDNPPGSNQSVVDSSWQIAGVRDFKGDGRSEILWRNANGDAVLWNPNSAGGFTGEDLGIVSSAWSIQRT